jgi:hypothetical protein
MANDQHSGGYTGPAPEPSRRISLTSEQDAEGGNIVGYGEADGTHVPDPASLTPGISRDFNHGTQTSNPPADPNAAANQAEANARVGELIQAIGDERAEFKRIIEEQAFNFKLQMEAMRATQNHSTSYLPANIDPETPINVGQLSQILDNFGRQSRAQIIREGVGITSAEEANILANNPQLDSVPEPRKSELLREAVLRARATGAGATDSRTTAGPIRATNSVQRPAPITRPAQRVTPHTEVSRGGASVDDTPPANLNQSLQAEYAAASQIKDRKERLAAQKAVYNKSLAANGVQNETHVGWKMG